MHMCLHNQSGRLRNSAKIRNNRRFGVKAGISGRAGLFTLMPCRSLPSVAASVHHRAREWGGGRGSSDIRALENRMIYFAWYCLERCVCFYLFLLIYLFVCLLSQLESV